MVKISKKDATMAPNKETLLEEMPDAPVIKLDLGNVFVEVDINHIRQFLYDMKSIENDLEGLPSMLNEFEEFTSDFYPDDCSAQHLKNYLKILKYSGFFFNNIALNLIHKKNPAQE